MSASPREPRTALVLGATGDQGWPQVVRLAQQGWRVLAAARSIERVAAAVAAAPSLDAPARARIVPTIVDHDDAESLTRAVCAADVVLANYPSSSLHDGGALIAAAERLGLAASRAGTRLVVLNTSLPLPERPLGFRAQDVRFAQRDALRAPGVPTISIQPVVYMDNLLRGWAYPAIVERDTFEYPHAPELEVSWLCQDDLASLMCAAVERPHLAGRDFNVGGPEILRGPEVARILSSVTRREIRFVSQPVDAFAARMHQVFARDASLDADALTTELARIYRWYNDAPEKPFCVDMTPVLRELPVTLTRFAEWAARQQWTRAGG
jgi:uncharacterized protein YbjT (DUF2867 family)